MLRQPGIVALVAEMRRSAPTSIAIGPILSLKADRLAVTANLFLEKTFGRSREEGNALSYGWQVKYELRDGLGVGVEGFGVIDDLGRPPPWHEQEHRIGPVIFTETEVRRSYKVAVDAGLLFGLTRDARRGAEAQSWRAARSDPARRPGPIGLRPRAASASASPRSRLWARAPSLRAPSPWRRLRCAARGGSAPACRRRRQPAP